MDLTKKPEKKTNKKMQTSVTYRESFLTEFHKMKINKQIDFLNLSRFLSPYFKTYHSDNVLVIRLKGTKTHCRITRLFTGFFKYEKITYFEVTISYSPAVYEFVCSSHKELLKKLIKHDLI